MKDQLYIRPKKIPEKSNVITMSPVGRLLRFASLWHYMKVVRLPLPLVPIVDRLNLAEINVKPLLTFLVLNEYRRILRCDSYHNSTPAVRQCIGI